MNNKLTIMVSSTVYGIEELRDQIGKQKSPTDDKPKQGRQNGARTQKSGRMDNE